MITTAPLLTFPSPWRTKPGSYRHPHDLSQFLRHGLLPSGLDHAAAVDHHIAVEAMRGYTIR